MYCRYLRNFYYARLIVQEYGETKLSEAKALAKKIFGQLRDTFIARVSASPTLSNVTMEAAVATGPSLRHPVSIRAAVGRIAVQFGVNEHYYRAEFDADTYELAGSDLDAQLASGRYCDYFMGLQINVLAMNARCVIQATTAMSTRLAAGTTCATG